MKEQEILRGLTSEQEKAVMFGSGPCLVVAGAGTGKTSVITRRISWLISKKLAKPDQILALTFTEKAANEMTLRVDELSDYVYSGLSISTFHSFGSDLISEFSYELGLSPDVRVLSSAEQVLFIKDKIFEFNFIHYQNLGDPSAMIKDLVKIFSRAKDEAVMPEEWIKKAKNKMKKSKDEAEREESEKELELANAYKKYNDLLRENGYIDYGDQIFLILDLLKKPSVAKKIRERYLYVLIDEFQDTNYVQSEVVRRIFGDSGNVMVVGDDDQSIYKFRGASVSNILDFKKSYEGARTIVLNKNFRSTQKILDISYKFINHNNPNRLEVKEKINKKLISDLGEGADPRLHLFSDETKEADFVAEKIEKELKKGKSPTDFAILVRANRHAEEFVLALKKRGIPYVFSGLAGLYQKIEIKNLISLISILSDPEDDLSLFHLSASEIYDFDMTDLAILSSYSRKNNKLLLSVYEKIDTLPKEVEVSDNTKEKAKKVFEDLKILREESKTSTAGEIVNLFLKNSGYYAKLTKEAKSGSLEAHNKINNIASFFDRVISFQRNYRDHSLEKFARYLE
ncbi:MAG: ATP-dependent helicase, partial [Patescibacteria group bacterium]|nr:ATP-dependent helicase [Patescibacteria group bacterium]